MDYIQECDNCTHFEMPLRPPTPTSPLSLVPTNHCFDQQVFPLQVAESAPRLTLWWQKSFLFASESVRNETVSSSFQSWIPVFWGIATNAKGEECTCRWSLYVWIMVQSTYWFPRDLTWGEQIWVHFKMWVAPCYTLKLKMANDKLSIYLNNFV